jgi:hypothetical protein
LQRRQQRQRKQSQYKTDSLHGDSSGFKEGIFRKMGISTPMEDPSIGGI